MRNGEPRLRKPEAVRLRSMRPTLPDPPRAERPGTGATNFSVRPRCAGRNRRIRSRGSGPVRTRADLRTRRRRIAPRRGLHPTVRERQFSVALDLDAIVVGGSSGGLRHVQARMPGRRACGRSSAVSTARPDERGQTTSRKCAHASTESTCSPHRCATPASTAACSAVSGRRSSTAEKSASCWMPSWTWRARAISSGCATVGAPTPRMERKVRPPGMGAHRFDVTGLSRP